MKSPVLAINGIPIKGLDSAAINYDPVEEEKIEDMNYWVIDGYRLSYTIKLNNPIKFIPITFECQIPQETIDKINGFMGKTTGTWKETIYASSSPEEDFRNMVNNLSDDDYIRLSPPVVLTEEEAFGDIDLKGKVEEDIEAYGKLGQINWKYTPESYGQPNVLTKAAIIDCYICDNQRPRYQSVISVDICHICARAQGL